MPEPKSNRQEIRVFGIGIGTGFIRGKAYLYDPEDDEPETLPIPKENLPAEMRRFESALHATREQILAIQRQIAESLGAKDAAIFDAHLMVVADNVLYSEVERALTDDLVCVESAFHQVCERYISTLQRTNDTYLRERAHDIEDVRKRVLQNLRGAPPEGSRLHNMDGPSIVIARNLTPTETVSIDRGSLLGFATDAGSVTSHTAIMARSLNIPAVVGLRRAMQLVESGDDVLLDGHSGILVIRPSPQTLAEYADRQSSDTALLSRLGKLREEPAITTDGHRVTLSANLEMLQDLPAVAANGAEGVGLYRTEFFYLSKTRLPTETELLENYRAVANAVPPHGLIIRTLDIGGDKIPGVLENVREANPFLGWRAIRFCLDRQDIFKTQLRAILQTAALSPGTVRLMFPMIASLEELLAAKVILEECRAELRREHKPCPDSIETGMMIEIPSAALVVRRLAREVSFFSIGTNDLIQYSIGVNRANERVAKLYLPTHPAILRLIHETVQAGRDAGIWTGLCGEMAGDPALTPLLLGLGLDELSVGPAVVPRIKQAIRSLDFARCQALAQDALQLDHAAEIARRSRALAEATYPDLL